MKSNLLLLISIFFSLSLTAQKTVSIQLNHLLNGVQFENELPASNDLGNAFMMDRLQYYISNFSITHDGGQEIQIDDLYVLVSLLESNEPTIIDLGEFDIETLESVSFYFGVDEEMNHADPALLPEDHPLAPKFPSMHWGWASGYRFIAIEGKSGPKIDQTMQFHGIGDEFFKKLTFPIVLENTDSYLVDFVAEYSALINGVDVSAGLVQHGNLGPIKTIASNFMTSVFSTPSIVNTAETTPDTYLQVFPNPSHDQLVNISTDLKSGSIKLHDSFGRLVNQFEVGSVQQLNIENAGVYSISLWDKQNELVLTKMVVVQ